MLFVCQVLGFGEYIEEVYSAYEQHKLETVVMFHFFMLLIWFVVAFMSVCLQDLERHFSFRWWGLSSIGYFKKIRNEV